MVAHCMRVLRKLTQHLNPTQIPVITGDQPVYVLMKQVQWQFPSEFGEEHFFVGMGGLHIEMAMLSIIGNLYQLCNVFSPFLFNIPILYLLEIKRLSYQLRGYEIATW